MGSGGLSTAVALGPNSRRCVDRTVQQFLPRYALALPAWHCAISKVLRSISSRETPTPIDSRRIESSDGDLTPRSIWLTKVRCKLARSASASCEIPMDSRADRTTCPKAASIEGFFRDVTTWNVYPTMPEVYSL